MIRRAMIVGLSLCLAGIAPIAAASAGEGLRAATLDEAPAAVLEEMAGRSVAHPTVFGGGIGIGTPTSGQGIGAAACYLAGVGVLAPPRSVAVLTVLQSCTFDGVDTLALDVPCPGSVCVGGGANFIPPPGGIRNACASGFAVFVVEDGTVVTEPGGGCGPI